jgi:hypothetical protein
MMLFHRASHRSFTSFQAAKEAIILTLQPIKKQINRSLGNGLPVTQAMMYEMKAQVDAIESWLDQLIEIEEDNPTKYITKEPDQITDASGNRPLARAVVRPVISRLPKPKI